MAAALSGLAHEYAYLTKTILRTIDPLGDPALAEASSELASGARHQDVLEPLLRGGSLRGGLRQSKPAAYVYCLSRDNTWNLRAIAEGCDDYWNPIIPDLTY